MALPFLKKQILSSPGPVALPRHWWCVPLAFYSVLFLVDAFILPFPLVSDCSNVSGFFGPGAYLAWYITTLSLVMKNAREGWSLRGNLFHPIRGHSFARWALSRTDTSPPAPNILAVDGDAIASITYPVIAAMCLVVQIVRKDAAQALACIFVLRRCLDFVFIAEVISSPLSIEKILKAAEDIKLVPFALMSTYLYQSFVESETPHPMRGSEVSKTSVQCGLIYIIAHLYALLARKENEQLIIVATVSEEYQRWIFMIGIILAQCVSLVAIPSRSLVPGTAASLGDLDQVCAFGTAAVVIICSWSRLLTQAYRSLTYYAKRVRRTRGMQSWPTRHIVQPPDPENVLPLLRPPIPSRSLENGP